MAEDNKNNEGAAVEYMSPEQADRVLDGDRESAFDADSPFTAEDMENPDWHAGARAMDPEDDDKAEERRKKREAEDQAWWAKHLAEEEEARKKRAKAAEDALPKDDGTFPENFAPRDRPSGTGGAGIHKWPTGQKGVYTKFYGIRRGSLFGPGTVSDAAIHKIASDLRNDGHHNVLLMGSDQTKQDLWLCLMKDNVEAFRLSMDNGVPPLLIHMHTDNGAYMPPPGSAAAKEYVAFINKLLPPGTAKGRAAQEDFNYKFYGPGGGPFRHVADQPAPQQVKAEQPAPPPAPDADDAAFWDDKKTPTDKKNPHQKKHARKKAWDSAARPSHMSAAPAQKYLTAMQEPSLGGTQGGGSSLPPGPRRPGGAGGLGGDAAKVALAGMSMEDLKKILDEPDAPPPVAEDFKAVSPPPLIRLGPMTPVEAAAEPVKGEILFEDASAEAQTLLAKSSHATEEPDEIELSDSEVDDLTVKDGPGILTKTNSDPAVSEPDEIELSNAEVDDLTIKDRPPILLTRDRKKTPVLNLIRPVPKKLGNVPDEIGKTPAGRMPDDLVESMNMGPGGDSDGVPIPIDYPDTTRDETAQRDRRMTPVNSKPAQIASSMKLEDLTGSIGDEELANSVDPYELDADGAITNLDIISIDDEPSHAADHEFGALPTAADLADTDKVAAHPVAEEPKPFFAPSPLLPLDVPVQRKTEPVSATLSQTVAGEFTARAAGQKQPPVPPANADKIIVKDIPGVTVERGPAPGKK